MNKQAPIETEWDNLDVPLKKADSWKQTAAGYEAVSETDIERPFIKMTNKIRMPVTNEINGNPT